MHVDVLESTYPEVKSEVLILGLFEDEPLNPPVRFADETLNGLLAKAVQKKQLTGEYKQLKSYAFNQGKTEWLVLVGLGKKAQWSLERMRRTSGIAAKAARQLGKTATTNIHTFTVQGPLESAKAVVVGTILATYQFTRYKTKDLDKIKTLDHLVLLDIEQPDIDGYMLCTSIRRQSKAPIVLMCPAEHEENILRGFQAGADTYILKPMNPKLLVARVIAQLRRTYRYGEEIKHSAVMPRTPLPVAQHHFPTKDFSAGWIECDACRYMGPEQKFHRHDPNNNLVLICPHCSERARVAFAVC